MPKLPDDIQAFEQERKEEELSPETLDALEAEAEDSDNDFEQSIANEI